MELYQRAEAFEVVLRGMRRREHFDASVVPDETRWAGAVLVAKLLEDSTLLAPPLMEAEGRELLPATFDELVRNQRVRVVLGRVAIPWAVRDKLRTTGASGDLDDVRTLDTAARQPRRGRLWVRASAARARHAAHATMFASTPVWEDFAARAGLEEEVEGKIEGYAIDLHKIGQPLLAAAIAVQWETALAAKHEPNGMLREFITRYHRAHGFYWAAGQMTAEAKRRFLDAAMAAVLSEAPTTSWEEELRYLALDYEGGFREPPPPPTHGTTASRYAWWSLWEGSGSGWSHETTREILTGLASIVVRFDDAYGHFDARYGRISTLLAASKSCLWLAHEVPMSVRFNRPEAISWMLTRFDTAALGLMLLGELHVPEETTSDELSAREVRRRRRRLAVFAEALPIFLLSLNGQRGGIATPILEALRWFSRTARQTRRPQHPPTTDFRDALWTALASARDGTMTITTGLRSGRPLLLNLADRDVHASLAEDAETSDSLSDTLWLLHQLLGFVRETQTEVRASPPVSPLVIAESIVAKYRAMLVMDATVGADGKVASAPWFGEYPELTTFPWETTAVVLAEAGQLGRWLNPVPQVSAALLHSPTDEYSPVADGLLTGLTVRHRHHLDVLLAAHQRLRGQGSWRVTGRSTATTVTDAIEEAVVALLKGDGSRGGVVALFDRDTPTLSGSDVVTALAKRTVQALETFRLGRRKEALTSWAGRTSDPAVLLAMLDGARTSATRAIIEDRLAVADILNEVEEEHWVPTLQRVAFDAARLGQVDLARRVIDYGNRVVGDEHRMHWQWEDTVFRAELLLHLEAHAAEKIALQPLPASALGPAEVQRRQQLEETRAFYQALERMESEPARAQAMFEDLLRREPRTAAYVVDYFASIVRVAQQVADPAGRREALEAALREWERLEPFVREGDRVTIDDTLSYNRLVALYGAERDDEADGVWASLSPPLRFHPEFVTLRLSSLRRRSLGHEATKLIAEANAYHGEDQPEGLDALLAADPTRPASFGAAPIENPWTAHRPRWLEMQQLQGGWLARVVAPSADDDLAAYLLQVHIEVGREFLVRATVIHGLKDENKYNDLFVSMLSLRLRLLGWHPEGQSRGGRSYGRPSSARSAGVGERDWLILDRYEDTLAVTEALRLRSVDRTTIEVHARKLFGYNATGAGQAYVTVFFEGANFDGFIEKYAAHIGTLATDPWTRVGEAAPAETSAISAGENKMRVVKVSYVQGKAKLDVYHLVLRLTVPARDRTAGGGGASKRVTAMSKKVAKPKAVRSKKVAKPKAVLSKKVAKPKAAAKRGIKAASRRTRRRGRRRGRPLRERRTSPSPRCSAPPA